MTKKELIIQVVGSIPQGNVATYGQVARLAGLPGHARYVGTVLKQLPHQSTLPWHRVINSQGRIAFPEGSDKWQLQTQKLAREGVVFRPSSRNLKQYLWQP